MGTCAICLRQAPAGYNQCRDCIATFSVQENPIEFRRNLSIPAGGSYAAEKQAERETCPNCGCLIDEGERLAARIAELEAALAASDAQRVAAVDGAEAYRQRLAKNERRIAELEWTLRETDGRLRSAYERRAWYEEDDEAQGLFARNRAALAKGGK